MNRKLIYIISWISLLLLWGIFGFGTAYPHRESNIQRTAVREKISSVSTTSPKRPAIPVTGNGQPETGIFLYYGFFGFGALTLILSLLSAANKATVPHPRPKEPEDKL